MECSNGWAAVFGIFIAPAVAYFIVLAANKWFK